ncbi:hypothetical protein B0H14DRAFT_3696612 [Mycena olivaceomarginata]|nr:hypothetical protein B0H14DRAFT_3696612 [Mycena olivaceomarginata]
MTTTTHCDLLAVYPKYAATAPPSSRPPPALHRCSCAHLRRRCAHRPRCVPRTALIHAASLIYTTHCSHRAPLPLCSSTPPPCPFTLPHDPHRIQRRPRCRRDHPSMWPPPPSSTPSLNSSPHGRPVTQQPPRLFPSRTTHSLHLLRASNVLAILLLLKAPCATKTTRIFLSLGGYALLPQAPPVSAPRQSALCFNLDVDNFNARHTYVASHQSSLISTSSTRGNSARALTGDGTSSIRHFMRKSCASSRSFRIADIDAQILELERTLSSLKEEKDFLRARLAIYTYPVLTLPNEIVSEIFVQVLPDFPRYPPPIGPLSPYPLCQICRKWRDYSVLYPSAVERHFIVVPQGWESSAETPLGTFLKNSRLVELRRMIIDHFHHTELSLPRLRGLNLGYSIEELVTPFVAPLYSVLSSELSPVPSSRGFQLTVITVLWVKLKDYSYLMNQLASGATGDYSHINSPGPCGGSRSQKTFFAAQDDTVDSITALVTRSGCNLRELSIINVQTTHVTAYHDAFPSTLLASSLEITEPFLIDRWEDDAESSDSDDESEGTDSED